MEHYPLIRYGQRNGKNSGACASKDIKKGTLILSEKVQLKPEFEHKFDQQCGIFQCKSCITKLMAAYHKMKSTDQDEYLKLRNRFDDESSRIHFEPQIYQSIKEMTKKTLDKMYPPVNDLFPFPSLEAEFVGNILEIFLSNCSTENANVGTGSVRIKFSRYNHSCSPNTISIHMDLNNMDVINVKTISKIISPEEITVNKAGVGALEMKNLKTRREFLSKYFAFECHCDLCEIEELKGDNSNYELYESMKVNVENLLEKFMQFDHNKQRKDTVENLKRLIASYKIMYQCAKECKANRIFIIYDILKPAFLCTAIAYNLSVKCGC